MKKTSNQSQKVDFRHFLEKFPELEMPVTLGEDTHHAFSEKNDPLPPQLILQFLQPFEETQADEFTEYVACFRIKGTAGFEAVVYWRAALMDYRYILVTFTRNGISIDRKVIAGTYADEDQITRSVATIDEDLSITIATGQTDHLSGQFDPRSSTVISLEILPDGQIGGN